jgi:hypothetical protein
MSHEAYGVICDIWHNMAGFSKNLLRHHLLGPPGSRVVLGFWRECDHGMKQEFKVELVREFNQLTESGGQVGKWEGVEVEALRMQILLLREEATRHRERQVHEREVE